MDEVVLDGHFEELGAVVDLDMGHSLLPRFDLILTFHPQKTLRPQYPLLDPS